MSTVHVVLDFAGCEYVSATSIECGPPNLERSNFFLSTCTFSQSRLTAAAIEERRRREENALVGIDGSIVEVVLCSEERWTALYLREFKQDRYRNDKVE